MKRLLFLPVLYFSVVVRSHKTTILRNLGFRCYSSSYFNFWNSLVITKATMRFSSIVLLASSVSAFSPSVPLQASSRSWALFAKPKVFIDGEAGTTGIQVRGRLEKRDDLEIISPPSELRKDPETRKQFINEADAVILCE